VCRVVGDRNTISTKIIRIQWNCLEVGGEMLGLLDGDRLGEISGAIDVAAAEEKREVSESSWNRGKVFT
jgi:hypothetical protein